MRKAFIRTLVDLASHDPSVMLLTGDIGFNALEEFRDKLPRQFINCGIAEQNMIGVATGLALCGRKVFVYSIIPFVTFRCFEHIRDDIAYHHLPICIAGVGSGYGYGILGSTHHPLEDVAVMSSLPSMTVVCPGDPIEVEAATRALVALNGPSYLRLGKAGEPSVHSGPLSPLQIGKALTLREGKDVTLFASGTMLETAAKATDLLSAEGISIRLLSMPTLKPIDKESILKASQETKLIVSLEEHGPIGGLAGSIAQILSASSHHAPHLALTAPDAFASTVGSQQYLRLQAGLTPEEVARRIRAAIS